jgi:hypothetical protein
VTITFKPIDKFRADDHKALLASTANLEKLRKAECAERDKVQKSIADEESNDPNLATRLTDLIAGRKPTVPTPFDVRLREVQVKIRDIDNDLDFLAAKEKQFEIEAQKRMVDDARPQIVAAEQAKWEAFVNLYEKFVPVWTAKRALHNHSIRSYDLFADSFDDFLGVPSDINSMWCELFRQGFAAGYIKKMPAALVPKR